MDNGLISDPLFQPPVRARFPYPGVTKMLCPLQLPRSKRAWGSLALVQVEGSAVQG
jgi:hypothetical protein